LVFHPELAALFQELEKVEERLMSGEDMDQALHQQASLIEKIEQRGGYKIQQGYESYLKLFELYDCDKDLSALSGGEQKKLALSAGLSALNELILWDEPTNHLDIES